MSYSYTNRVTAHDYTKFNTLVCLRNARVYYITYNFF